MSAHSVPQPMVRLTVLVTPEAKAVLAADAAEKGKPMGQLVRDLIDRQYFGGPAVVAGWQITAAVRRPEARPETQPARIRLREWVSRSGRDR